MNAATRYINVIFLDIDGVLNGYNFWNLLGWDIVSKFHSNKLKGWYRNITEPFGVHERKVKRLAKIVHKTDAKVVISSSWRFSLQSRSLTDWRFSLQSSNLTDDDKKLLDLFDKYNIEIYDYTPRSNDGKRYKEINTWLSGHCEVKNFVILDDENFDLQCFIGNKLVQTSSVPRGRMIKGYWYENTGLKRKHIRKAIKMLNRT